MHKLRGQRLALDVECETAPCRRPNTNLPNRQDFPRNSFGSSSNAGGPNLFEIPTGFHVSGDSERSLDRLFWADRFEIRSRAFTSNDLASRIILNPLTLRLNPSCGDNLPDLWPQPNKNRKMLLTGQKYSVYYD